MTTRRRAAMRYRLTEASQIRGVYTEALAGGKTPDEALADARAAEMRENAVPEVLGANGRRYRFTEGSEIRGVYTEAIAAGKTPAEALALADSRAAELGETVSVPVVGGDHGRG